MDKSLNKFISETGFCSRREADKYIEQGRVTINNNVAVKGNRVTEGDVVEIDGEPVKKKDRTVYLVFNKPVGITCTTDLKDKYNIISFINYKSRIFPIGRLDKPSEGLIFLTNDGDIVNKILRAGNNHEKEYIVTTDKPVNAAFVDKMSNGIRIMDKVTKKCFVKQEGKNRFRIILTQGLNRQIRRMCLVLGYHVTKLKRVRIMSIILGNLAVGQWRYFTKHFLVTLSYTDPVTIFLTNDGDIVNKILRAGNNHEKEYIVTTDKPVNAAFVDKMSNGIRIMDKVTKKCFVKQEGKNRFRIILTQGLNRQIRRMCLVLGYHVTKLKRVRIMSIILGNLAVGQWRYFTPAEIKTIEELVAGSSKTADGSNYVENDVQE